MDPNISTNINELQSIDDIDVLREKSLLLHEQLERTRDASARRQTELEQELFEVQQQSENVQKKLAETSKLADDLKEQLNILESERVERSRRLVQLETLHDTSESEKAQLRRQCEQLLAEKTSLSELIDSKNEDIATKKGEIFSLREERRALVTQICEFKVKQGDLESRELAIQHRENLLAEERELILQEKEYLRNELRERDLGVQQLRQENMKQNMDHELVMMKKDDELRQSRLDLDNSKTQCKRSAEHLEELNKKMKEAADAFALREESYEKELQCQARLTQIHKQAADEAECKLEELSSSLDSVQQLFNDAKEQHFAVQEQMTQVRADFEKEMKEKDGIIVELRDELEKANELLRSKHRVMLTEEEVAALSPAAAAASRLIKTGSSLTQIYRDHVKVVEELEMQKLENKRIEAYFRELVQEIEAKAPLLRKQQEDYSSSLATIGNMKRQLNDVAKSQQKLQNDNDSLNRKLTYTKAELERYQRDNADLASQVRELLFCGEKMRAGESTSAPMDVSQQPSAGDLLLFRNIDELQSMNQRQLSALREAEARREEMVKAAQETEMSKIRAEIEGYSTEVEQLRDQREKLNQLLEAIRDERDTYKRLYMKTQTERDVAVEKAKAPAELVETATVKSAFEKLRAEFESYRQEKTEAEKSLQEKVDKHEATIADLRSANAKLNSEVEYQLERFKVLSVNIDSYKKEISSLNERNEKTASTLASYKRTVDHVTEQLQSTTEDMNRAKAEHSRLERQLNEARQNASLAQRELEILRKQEQTQNMVSMTLQEMDVRLKQHEAEELERLRSDVESLTQERSYLQSNIKTLSEQNQDYVRECKTKIASLETSAADSERQLEHLRSQLQWTEEQLENEKAKAQEFKKELDGLQSAYQDASAGRFHKEAQQLQTRLTYLEGRHAEANHKIEELSSALTMANKASKHYQKNAQALEEELNVQRNMLQAERVASENEIENHKSLLEQAESYQEAWKKEAEGLQQRLDDLMRQNENADQLATLRSENEELKNRVEELRAKHEIEEKRVTQVRHVALKYKNQVNEIEGREKELQNEIDSLREAYQNSEMEKKEMEARCTALELRVKEPVLPSFEPSPESGTLLSEMEELKKREDELKRSLADAGQRLVVSQAEKKQLEAAVDQLKQEQEKLEQMSDERKFRLDSLTSLHSQCENRHQKLSSEYAAMLDQYQKLSVQFNALSEQYQNEKSNWDKQIQDAKASSRATPVQLVSAMPAGVIVPQPERPSPGPSQEQRTVPIKPSRQFPMVANVKPIASQPRSTAPIPPTAISPGPSFPDQSSAVTSLPPVPISVSTTVISSTQQSSTPTTSVPHAVVPPHVDSGLGTVSASSDAFGDISSSVVITVEAPGTSEASATSFDIEAPIVASKRRPPQDPSDRATKRSRASSPEQVSTSEQRAPPLFSTLPSLPEEIVESGSNLQAVVGSSLDDQNDEVIFVEEVERGIEPESSGQEHGLEDSRGAGQSVAVTTASAEAGQNRTVTQQPPLMPALMSSSSSFWDIGDDGIVPSTPTLVTRRNEQEIAGAAVPQPRFSFHIQEPYPTSQIFATPPIEVTAHRSVPSTPRGTTPPEGDREPAPSSTIIDIMNIGVDQPQPSGQIAEPEIIENIMTGEEEQEGTSEAVAAKAEGAERGPESGTEEFNEPTTSQPRSSRIRLNLSRVVGEEPQQTSAPGSPGTFSEPATSTVTTGTRAMARRAGVRRARVRGGHGRGNNSDQ